MILYLLRHGEAENRGVSDNARQLTPAGHRHNLAVAMQWAQRQPDVTAALVSPYVRAQQTSVDIQQVLPGLQFQDWALITPDTDPHAVLDALASRSDESVLLVSHNPLLSNLANLLLDGAYTDRIILGTSNLVCLEFSELAIGCGELRYTLSP